MEILEISWPQCIMGSMSVEKLPSWLSALWWPVFTGTLIFLGCLLYDPNGYVLVHNYPHIFLLSALCFFLSFVWLIGALVFTAHKRMQLRKMEWFKIIFAAIVLTLVCGLWVIN
jgi:hypothetical protein